MLKPSDRRRSAVEEKRGPGAEGTGCSGLQRMPASAEEVMSGSEEEDAGAPPMMHEDGDWNLSAFVQLPRTLCTPDNLCTPSSQTNKVKRSQERSGQSSPGAPPCI